MEASFREVIISDTANSDSEQSVHEREFETLKNVLALKNMLEFIKNNEVLWQSYRQEGVSNFPPHRIYSWLVEKGFFQSFLDSCLLI